MDLRCLVSTMIVSTGLRSVRPGSAGGFQGVFHVAAACLTDRKWVSLQTSSSGSGFVGWCCSSLNGVGPPKHLLCLDFSRVPMAALVLQLLPHVEAREAEVGAVRRPVCGGDARPLSVGIVFQFFRFIHEVASCCLGLFPVAVILNASADLAGRTRLRRRLLEAVAARRGGRWGRGIYDEPDTIEQLTGAPFRRGRRAGHRVPPGVGHGYGWFCCAGSHRNRPPGQLLRPRRGRRFPPRYPVPTRHDSRHLVVMRRLQMDSLPLCRRFDGLSLLASSDGPFHIESRAPPRAPDEAAAKLLKDRLAADLHERYRWVAELIASTRSHHWNPQPALPVRGQGQVVVVARFVWW